MGGPREESLRGGPREVSRRRVALWRRPVAVTALLGLLVTACAEGQGGGPGPPSGADDDLRVVATTSILGDVVEQLVGDAGTVGVLVPPGADPHGYEISARDAAGLREADLVVANGLRLEEGLQGALEAAADEGVRVFELAGRLDPIAAGGWRPHDDAHDGAGGHEAAQERGQHPGGDHEEEADQGERPPDPHVWHDPVRMADGVALIAEQLAEVAPQVPADEWERRADEYAGRLLDLHAEIEEILAVVPDERRTLITNHDSFGYLAARYDLEILGTVLPGSSTDAETDPRAFARLVETVERAGVRAVFSEHTGSERLAEQLAAEAVDRGGPEIAVVELYSDALGAPGSGAASYPDLLRTNARRIAEALE